MFKSICIASAAFLMLVSCQFNGITGSGTIVTETRPVTETFRSIDISKGIEVVLEQAPNASITVEADDNVQKHIITRIENGVLTVTSDFNSFRNVTKKVTVKMPVVESIEVSSGSSLSTTGTIRSKDLKINSDSGSEATVRIEAEKATCESSSGSHINVEGKAITLETASSSGSDIDAQHLLSNEVTASASSGSTIDVHPLVSLDAEASSGGNINYFNVPNRIRKTSNSGGSVNRQ